MKTDQDARNDGIDTRAVVLEGIQQLQVAFEDLGDRAASQIALTHNVAFILDVHTVNVPRSRVDEARAKLVEMRDHLQAANKFDWTVVCNHAIWWLSAILEG